MFCHDFYDACTIDCSGVNDVELSLELAGMALHLSTGYYFDAYGDAYTQQAGNRHTGCVETRCLT